MDSWIDLHTHSTASDGGDTPQNLLNHAKEAGLKAIALTDHDTVFGIRPFLEYAAAIDMEAIPGIEISTFLFKKEIHILGLFIDDSAKSLLEPLAYLRQTRIDRNRKMMERLRSAGFLITDDDVNEFAQGDSIGRPHIARALVKKGYFETVQEAFAKCLKRGTPFYIPRNFLAPNQSIRIIREAGGLAFWAHPLHERRGDRAFLRKFLKQLMGWGLNGVEGYYSLFTERQHAITLSVAEELGLLVSGGSDYHGSNQPTISLGTGRGDLRIPYSVLEKIREYRTLHS